MAARLMSKMIASILYCHERNVCHRDVKLDNFVYEGDDEDAELKLIDFGLSHVLLHTQEKMHDRVGMPGRLRAPPTRRPVPLPRGPAWLRPKGTGRADRRTLRPSRCLSLCR
jgi:serine/threonine protein kinase